MSSRAFLPSCCCPWNSCPYLAVQSSGFLATHLLTPLPEVLPPHSALLEGASGLGPRASSLSVHSLSFMPMALNTATGFPDLFVDTGSILNWLLQLTIQHLKFIFSPTGPHICSLKTASLNEYMNELWSFADEAVIKRTGSNGQSFRQNSGRYMLWGCILYKPGLLKQISLPVS